MFSTNFLSRQAQLHSDFVAEFTSSFYVDPGFDQEAICSIVGDIFYTNFDNPTQFKASILQKQNVIGLHVVATALEVANKYFDRKRKADLLTAGEDTPEVKRARLEDPILDVLPEPSLTTAPECKAFVLQLISQGNNNVIKETFAAIGQNASDDMLVITCQTLAELLCRANIGWVEQESEISYDNISCLLPLLLHPNDAVVENGCWCLLNIATQKKYRNSICINNDLQSILSLLRHKNSNIVSLACRCLSTLTGECCLKLFSASTIIGWIDPVMDLFGHENPDIVIWACRCLASLSIDGPADAKAHIALKAAEPILKLLHSEDPRITQAACWSFNEMYTTYGGHKNIITKETEKLFSLLENQDATLVIPAMQILFNVLYFTRSESDANCMNIFSAFVQLLQHNNCEVRVIACVLLGCMFQSKIPHNKMYAQKFEELGGVDILFRSIDDNATLSSSLDIVTLHGGSHAYEFVAEESLKCLSILASSTTVSPSVTMNRILYVAKFLAHKNEKIIENTLWFVLDAIVSIRAAADVDSNLYSYCLQVVNASLLGPVVQFIIHPNVAIASLALHCFGKMSSQRAHEVRGGSVIKKGMESVILQLKNKNPTVCASACSCIISLASPLTENHKENCVYLHSLGSVDALLSVLECGQEELSRDVLWSLFAIESTSDNYLKVQNFLMGPSAAVLLKSGQERILTPLFAIIAKVLGRSYCNEWFYGINKDLLVDQLLLKIETKSRSLIRASLECLDLLMLINIERFNNDILKRKHLANALSQLFDHQIEPALTLSCLCWLILSNLEEDDVDSSIEWLCSSSVIKFLSCQKPFSSSMLMSILCFIYDNKKVLAFNLFRSYEFLSFLKARKNGLMNRLQTDSKFVELLKSRALNSFILNDWLAYAIAVDDTQAVYGTALDSIIAKEVIDQSTFANFLTITSSMCSGKELLPLTFPFTPNHTIDDWCQKMYAEKKFVDVTFVAGGIKIPCHRCVIAPQSEYFQILFTNGMKEQNQSLITLHEIEPEIFKKVVAFMYLKKCTFESMDEIIKIAYAANKFQVNELGDVCRGLLGSSLTQESVVDILQFAVDTYDKELQKSAAHWIARNYCTFTDKLKAFVCEHWQFIYKTLFGD